MEVKVPSMLAVADNAVELDLTFTVSLERGDASVGAGPGVGEWQAYLKPPGGGRIDVSDVLDRAMTDEDRERLADWLYRAAVERLTD